MQIEYYTNGNENGNGDRSLIGDLPLNSYIRRRTFGDAEEQQNNGLLLDLVLYQRFDYIIPLATIIATRVKVQCETPMGLYLDNKAAILFA